MYNGGCGGGGEGVVELVMGRGGGREGVEGRWRS